jgi:hypothetical protein
MIPSSKDVPTVISPELDGGELRRVKNSFPRHLVEAEGHGEKAWEEAQNDRKIHFFPAEAWQRIFGSK